MRQPLDLNADSPFSRLCRDMARHCPYLRPACEAGLVFARRIKVAEGANLLSAQEQVFAELVVETEAFRTNRSQLQPKHQMLLNYNLIVDAPTTLDGQDLVDFNSYMLKLLYTGKACVFGVFWKGQDEELTCGQKMPVPELNVVSIRSRVPKVDRRFFERHNQHLLLSHVNGWDDGGDPFVQIRPDWIPTRSLDHQRIIARGIWAEAVSWATNILDRVQQTA